MPAQATDLPQPMPPGKYCLKSIRPFQKRNNLYSVCSVEEEEQQQQRVAGESDE